MAMQSVGRRLIVMVLAWGGFASALADPNQGLQLVLEVNPRFAPEISVLADAAPLKSLLQQWHEHGANDANDANAPHGIRVGTHNHALHVRYRRDAPMLAFIAHAKQHMPHLRWEKLKPPKAYRVTLTPLVSRLRMDAATIGNIAALKQRAANMQLEAVIIQRLGRNRLQVSIPKLAGRDHAKIKQDLLNSSTLEVRGGCDQSSTLLGRQSLANDVARGIKPTPQGCELFLTSRGSPVLLKDSVVITGENLVKVHAQRQDYDGRPALLVDLDEAGGKQMLAYTGDHLGKSMATVLVEQRYERQQVDGKAVSVPIREPYVLQEATIQGQFSRSFMITGFTMNEAQSMATKIQEGKLPAALLLVSEQLIPSDKLRK